MQFSWKMKPWILVFKYCEKKHIKKMVLESAWVQGSASWFASCVILGKLLHPLCDSVPSSENRDEDDV